MSLVASIAAVSFCFVGSILGIVFGHIARSRIRRSGDQGSGLALAGLVLGYLGVAFVVVVAAGIGILIAVTAGNADHDAASDAHALDRQIVDLAAARGQDPRFAELIARVLQDSSDPAWVRGDVTVGSTGLDAVGANDAELGAAGWRLTVKGDFNGHACLTVPRAAISRSSDVTEGECGS